MSSTPVPPVDPKTGPLAAKPSRSAPSPASASPRSSMKFAAKPTGSPRPARREGPSTETGDTTVTDKETSTNRFGTLQGRTGLASSAFSAATMSPRTMKFMASSSAAPDYAAGLAHSPSALSVKRNVITAKKVLSQPLMTGVDRDDISFPSFDQVLLSTTASDITKHAPSANVKYALLPKGAAVKLNRTEKPRREVNAPSVPGRDEPPLFVTDAVDQMSAPNVIVTSHGEELARAPESHVTYSLPANVGEGLCLLDEDQSPLSKDENEDEWAHKEAPLLANASFGAAALDVPRYPMLALAGLGTDERYRQPRLVAPWSFVPHRQIVAEVSKVVFDAGTHEPMYVTIAVYDAERRIKVTESFDVTCSSAEELALLGPTYRADPTTKSRKAIFSLPYSSKDLYLIAYLSKMLKGEDADKSLEPYMKGAAVKPKERAKLTQEAKEMGPKIGRHRQVIAWGVRRLFSNNDDFLLGADSRIEFYRVKFDMLRNGVFQLPKDIEDRRYRQVPGGRVELQASFMGDEPPPGRLNPMLTPLHPPTVKDSLREMQMFTQDDTSHPATSYLNLLFVWPDFVDFSNHSLPGVSNIRNICVEVCLKANDDDAKAPGLPCVVGSCIQPMVDTEGTTGVTYHKQKPRFCEEFKLRLPAALTTAKAHLLFRFLQVSCDQKKARKGDRTDVVVGYVPFTLFDEDDMLRESGPYSMPVLCPNADGSLPKGYLSSMENAGRSLSASVEEDNDGGAGDRSSSPMQALATPPTIRRMPTLRRNTLRGSSKDAVLPALDDESGMRYVDRGKARFEFRLQLESTIYTQDLYVHKFFTRYTTWQKESSTPMTKTVRNLNRSPSQVVVRHFPVLAVELLTIIADDRAESDLQLESFLTFCACVETIAKEAGEKVADGYAAHIFGAGRQPLAWETFYRRVIKIFISVMKSDEPRAEATYRIASLLFTLIFKSMVMELDAHKLMDKPPTERFASASLKDELREFYMLLRRRVCELAESSFTISKTLNAAVALFSRDLLDIFDRGLVFELIFDYTTRLDPELENISLQLFKHTFLRILAEHSYFLALNSPVCPPVRQVSTVNVEWWKRHFLVSLILRELEVAMVTNITSKSQSSNDDTKQQGLVVALDALAGLLRSHDTDPRYQDDASRAVVARLYFPFVLLVCDLIGFVNKYPRDEQRLVFASWLWILRNVGAEWRSEWWKNEVVKRRMALLAGLRIALKGFTEESRTRSAPANDTLGMGGKVRSFAAKKDGSLADMRAIEATYGAGRSAGVGGVSSSGGGEGSSYRSFMKDRSSGASLRRGNSTEEAARDGGRSDNFVHKASTSETKEYIESLYDKQGGSGPVVRKGGYRAWANAGKRSSVGLDALTSIRGRLKSNSGRMTGGAGARTTVGRRGLGSSVLHSLSTSLEISMVCLDLLLAFMEDFKADISSQSSQYAKRCFSALRDMLKQDSPTAFLPPLFAAVNRLMKQFRPQLFRFPNSTCSKLVNELLPYLTVRDQKVRGVATSLISSFIAENHAETKNISRMKLQMTIGVSELVQGGDDFRALRSSLLALVPVAGKVSTTLGTEVEELVKRLFSVLTDSARIVQYRWDLETTADLYYQIAKGYIDSPDLRVTWILQLAQLHKSKEQWEEAVHANVVAAALVAKYLLLLKRIPASTPTDFTSLYPSIESELTMPGIAALESLKKDVCRSKHFSEAGFIDLLLEAVKILKRSKLYELAIEVYKILLPVYEERGDYARQGRVHSDLQALCELAAQEEKSAERIFSNHYRVNFFGEQFEHLDGNEYIYREPAAVRIAEFTQNIVMQYGLRLGLRDGIPLVPNSRRIKPGDMNPKEPQMQIISVDSYFGEDEAANRLTDYQRNYDVNKFVFETPYHPEGAEKNMENQHIRRTILHTETAFPSTRKRLRVSKKEEVVLTPIEVGIALIEGKCSALEKELNSSSPDSKALQLVLQGSLLLQVNAGPLAVFQTFLGDSVAKHSADHVDKLRVSMKRFLHDLSDGVALNKTLIGPQQADLQELLEEGIVKFRATVAPLSNGMINEDEG